MQRSSELVPVGPPTTGGVSLAFAIVALSSALFVAAVPFARTPLAPVPAFIPAYEAALVASDLITAALLFGQFTYLRSRALLLLAAGYVFTAVVATAHALTFPGLVTPGGLLGAGPQSTAWLYMFWHGAFPVCVIGYALLKDSARDIIQGNRAGAVAGTCAAAIALAALFVAIATAGRESLPPIMAGNSYTPQMVVVVSTVWASSAAALVVLWRRKPHTVLDVWLMVVMCAWIFDIALSAVLNGGRHDLGFYAGRIYGLVAASVVLAMLLVENARMYLRLAREADSREAEHSRLVVANEQLEQARRAAQDAERAKGAFLAMMSHEIRTPMNGIFGMLELLSLMPLGSEQRTTLEIVRDSSRSLLRIIDDVLDFSRIEAGRLELRPEPTSVAAVMQRVCQVYSGNASSKGLNLEHRVDARIAPSLMVDPLRLQQILNNLVSNAIKFTDTGRVSLQARLLEREANAEKVRFVVQDTGPGISGDDRARLFQPFAQAGSRSTTGTGLGLSICRRLAQMMGGSLDMESDVGIGTRVILTIAMPLAAETQACTVATEAPQQAAGAPNLPATAPTEAAARASNRLVLVVDDHPVNRMLLVRQLATLGYAADAAADGVEAIAKLGAGGVGAVITDCNMPQMDGYELARTIRALESRSDAKRLPIIACTANALTGEAANCFAAGMDDYLAKPVSLEQLGRKIAHWLPMGPPRPGGMRAGAAIEIAALDALTGGDDATRREVLFQFMHYGAEDTDCLRVAVAGRQRETVLQYAHRMKGAAASIGAAGLSAACGDLEESARRDDWPAIAAGMDHFERHMASLRAHVAQLEA